MAKDRRQQSQKTGVRDHASELTSVRRVEEPAYEDIARRAYALYEARGGEHGRDLDDWFTAETETRQQRPR
jgi:Protein of unknown function (DUF2934)